MLLGANLFKLKTRRPSFKKSLNAARFNVNNVKGLQLQQDVHYFPAKHYQGCYYNFVLYNMTGRYGLCTSWPSGALLEFSG